MSVLRNMLESLPRSKVVLETFDRSGQVAQKLTGEDLIGCVRSLRGQFDGWSGHDGRKVVALLFKPEETIEFLIAAFAAMSRGYTVVPLYPNWSAETQLDYLRAYKLGSILAGGGFEARARAWADDPRCGIERVVPIDARALLAASGGTRGGPRGEIDFDMRSDQACAWIFTSGTSGKLAKLTEITLGNIEAAMENIQQLDFLYAGMTVHCPLSASHIFAFVAILGFLSVQPGRVLFSDVQYLQRLPESRTGRVDGIVLVPIVLNRMRAGFYEKLTARMDPKTAPPELKKLARIPLAARKLLKRVALRAERAVLDVETRGKSNPAGWAAIRLVRKLFGTMFAKRLGSPEFVVVGGAKPSLQSMAFFEAMGIRCLQGWGMTETTGPLAVCSLGDRFRGAFGTCGNLFRQTRAYIEDGELVVEGPQIARGYHQPDGTFEAFHGRKRTGDHAEFDSTGRLKVLGKASDRITTENGLNYNPIPFEEILHALDLEARHLIEESVVIGDAQPRLGAVFFLRENVPLDAESRAYVDSLIRTFNSSRPVDEKIGPWAFSGKPFKDAGVMGPSGKLVRRRVEEKYAWVFKRSLEMAPAT